MSFVKMSQLRGSFNSRRPHIPKFGRHPFVGLNNGRLGSNFGSARNGGSRFFFQTRFGRKWIFFRHASKKSFRQLLESNEKKNSSFVENVVEFADNLFS